MTDFEIDPLRLDWEWNRQGNLAYSYGESLAEHQKSYDEAKNILSVVQAEVAKKARRQPHRYGLEKATDESIKAAVAASEEVKAALQEVVEARYSLEIAKSASNAIEHKKRGLEKAVDLFLAGYYSEPKAQGDNKEQTEELSKAEVRRRGARRRQNRRANRSESDSD